MPDDVGYIDEYLNKRFSKICDYERNRKITVGEFVNKHPYGVYLITMHGHITCSIDGIIYDTFNPENRIVRGIYKVEGKRES